MSICLKIKDIFLNTPQVKIEVKMEIIKYLKMKNDKDATYQNLWNVAKAVFSRPLGLKYI